MAQLLVGTVILGREKLDRNWIELSVELGRYFTKSVLQGELHTSI